MVFLTSDSHYFHANIIKYARRPFTCLHDMNKVMTERWNEVIKPGDTVFHLGDVAFGSKKKLTALRERLNGTIYLVRGNHDGSITKMNDAGFIVISPGYRKIEGIKFRLTHAYNNKSFPRYLWGLHGHRHAIYPPDEGEYVDYRQKSINVGVDYHEYYPISINYIKEIIRGEFK